MYEPRLEVLLGALLAVVADEVRKWTPPTPAERNRAFEIGFRLVYPLSEDARKAPFLL